MTSNDHENEDGTDTDNFNFTLTLNNRYLSCLNHIQCANTVAVPLVLVMFVHCSKPTCFCERIAVQTLDVPRFIMVMIQSECDLTKRKNFSPCIEEECMKS